MCKDNAKPVTKWSEPLPIETIAFNGEDWIIFTELAGATKAHIKFHFDKEFTERTIEGRETKVN